MNYFDIVFIIALLWSAYKGFTKGLIIQAASLVALLLGIWGAIRFSGFTADLLIEKFELKTQYLSLIAFALTFVAIVIGVHLLARAVDKLAKAVALGFVNRILGLVFSVLKTAFIISIVLVVLNTIDSKTPFLPDEKKEESILYEPLSILAPMLFPYLHFDQIQDKFRKESENSHEASI